MEEEALQEGMVKKRPRLGKWSRNDRGKRRMRRGSIRYLSIMPIITSHALVLSSCYDRVGVWSKKSEVKCVPRECLTKSNGGKRGGGGGGGGGGGSAGIATGRSRGAFFKEPQANQRRSVCRTLTGSWGMFLLYAGQMAATTPQTRFLAHCNVLKYNREDIQKGACFAESGPRPFVQSGNPLIRNSASR